MAAQLISIKNDERKYRISTGEIISIKVDGDSAFAFNSKGQEIGSAIFRVIDNEYEEVHKLTWMYLDKLETDTQSYKRKGIGRAVVETYKEYWGVDITAAENDGQQNDDGSHLTQDAPYFIAKLRREGIIRSVYLGDEDDY